MLSTIETQLSVNIAYTIMNLLKMYQGNNRVGTKFKDSSRPNKTMGTSVIDCLLI